MKVSNIIIFGSLILATIFGIFGQGIAYFLNKNIVQIAPIYYLTVLTWTSVFLYIVPVVFTYNASKREMISKNRADLYFTIIGFTGIITSLWSYLFWQCGGGNEEREILENKN